MKRHVVIIDRDRSTSESLAQFSENSDLRFTQISSRAELEMVFDIASTDLVLVDLDFDGDDGSAIVKSLVELETIPIIILSKARTGSTDKVIGLELGADDFIEKPFDPIEVLARVWVCLRRPTDLYVRQRQTIHRFNGWSLNDRLRLLGDDEGHNYNLPDNEFRVLSAFVRSSGKTLTRSQLLQFVHRGVSDLNERSIDVIVNRLRRKLERTTKHLFIRTERGLGYTFLPKVQTLTQNPPGQQIVLGLGSRSAHTRVKTERG